MNVRPGGRLQFVLVAEAGAPLFAVMDPPQSLMETEAPHPVLMEPSQSVLQMIVKS